MKVTSATLLLFLNQALPSLSQYSSDVVDVAFEMFKGSDNLDKAVDGFQADDGEYQPACMDPVDNYITCIDVPDDIDETTFLVSPTVPAGTQLKDLMDTPDYDLGTGLIEAFTGSVTSSDCDEVGDFGLATYQWLSGSDFETPVTVTSLVKDFSKDESRFICGTGPLTEAAQAMLGDSVRDGSFQNVLGSSKIAFAEKNLDKAIEAIQSEMPDDVQPACMDPVRNYVSCLSLPTEIDESTFLAHPLVPVGTKLGDIQGSDYELAKGMIDSLTAAVSPDDCNEVGNVGLASFGWLSSVDFETPITATTFVKDFSLDMDRRRKLRSRQTHADAEKYVCSTGPLTPGGNASDALSATSDMMRAVDNIQGAMLSFLDTEDRAQPGCVHPTDNYVTCIDVQEDIDDTIFIDHPLVPQGTTLGSLKGTPDYEMGKGLITAFIEATSCSTDSNFGLATYDWLSASDSTTPVSATSIVMNFQGFVDMWKMTDEEKMDNNDWQAMTYICGSEPLNETPLEM